MIKVEIQFCSDHDDDFECVGDCSDCFLFLDLKRCGYETNDSYHG